MTAPVVVRGSPVGYVEPELFAVECENLKNFLIENNNQWFTSRELALECGFPVKSTFVDLRAAVRSLRFQGFPIDSGHRGFKMSNSSFEMRRLADRLKKRAGEIIAVADAIERRIKEGGFVEQA